MWALSLTTLVVLTITPAHAWWPAGHTLLAVAAVRALPAEVPRFFRAGHELVGHVAQDADVHKNRGTPHLMEAETPEHYLDLELLQGKPLPPTRTGYYALLAELKLRPRDVGTLPYAVAEGTERLALAFAEHRRWPENPHIRTRCLVYAGQMSHYAADLGMPLHLTIHHDGRAREDGTSPRSGIHAWLDGAMERASLKESELGRGAPVNAFPELMPGILAEITAGRILIERVYELEGDLKSSAREGGTMSAPLRSFVQERGRATTSFLASLYLTAWRKSAEIKLPDWVKR